MRVDVEEVFQVTETGTVIVIGTESGIGIVTKIVKGLARGMVGEAVKGGEGWIRSTAVVEMEVREVEIDTESVIGAGRVPLAGVVAEGHLEILSSYITEFCC